MQHVLVDVLVRAEQAAEQPAEPGPVGRARPEPDRDGGAAPCVGRRRRRASGPRPPRIRRPTPPPARVPGPLPCRGTRASRSPLRDGGRWPAVPRRPADRLTAADVRLHPARDGGRPPGADGPRDRAQDRPAGGLVRLRRRAELPLAGGDRRGGPAAADRPRRHHPAHGEGPRTGVLGPCPRCGRGFSRASHCEAVAGPRARLRSPSPR